MTPEQLYYQYSNSPCFDLDGAGTPYRLAELTTFLKQIKYPCLKNVPGYSGLYSGSGQIALPYKYLEVFDPHLFSEIQPNIYAGSAHAIRNAADVSRACDLVFYSDKTNSYGRITESSLNFWGARGATEHMTFFGYNYITRCLFVLGPDLVDYNTARQRGTGCDDMNCLPPFKRGQQISALGAAFSCEEDDSGQKECTPCKKCPPEDDTDPCCQGLSCADRANICCGDPTGDADIFFYETSIHDDIFNKPKSDRIVEVNQDRTTIYHVGYLKRQSYGGYINTKDLSDKWWTCPKDLAIAYMQKNNGYDYKNNVGNVSNNIIQRTRIISYVDNIEDIKKLLYNGYGIVLSTNIGFSREKDSYGLAFPDRIWYHSYAVVGYDDTKKYFDECVYVFANSWGDWNTGGHPPWGRLPKGCFLVTESHLKGMINLQRIDKIGCKNKKQLWLAGDGERFIDIPGCVEDNDCVPWTCDTKQTPMGMAFVVCFTPELKHRSFNYKKMIKDPELDYRFSGFTSIRVSGIKPKEGFGATKHNILINEQISGLLNNSALTSAPVVFDELQIKKNFDGLYDYSDVPLINFETAYNISSNPDKILPYLDLNLPTNSGKDNNIYYKNNLINYSSVFNKLTKLSNESVCLVGNSLDISDQETSIYINEIYSTNLQLSNLSGLNVNKINAKEIKIDTLKGINICNPERRNINISADKITITNCNISVDNLNIKANKFITIINSTVKCTIESPLVLFQKSDNLADIHGNVLFLGGSTNNASGSVYGDALFSNDSIGLAIPGGQGFSSETSENNGNIYGNAFFRASNNNKYIQYDCYLDPQSSSSGVDSVVEGRIIKQDSVVRM